MVKKISVVFMSLALILLLSFSVFAEADVPRLTDDAGLLTESEAQEVLETLDSVSEKYGVDIAVHTTESTGGTSVMTYSDQYFLDHGFGTGSDASGTLLTISMEARDWHISTHGEGIQAFTDYGIEQLGEQIVPYLSSGDYAGAFEEYARIADRYFASEREGNPVDVPPAKPISVIILIVIALIAGFLFSFAITGSMKKKMKSVARQASASAYTTDSGIELTENSDRYLYHRVVAVPIPRENSSRGGSSTHFTGGSSFGGGGGKF